MLADKEFVIKFAAKDMNFPFDFSQYVIRVEPIDEDIKLRVMCKYGITDADIERALHIYMKRHAHKQWGSVLYDIHWGSGWKWQECLDHCITAPPEDILNEYSMSTLSIDPSTEDFEYCNDFVFREGYIRFREPIVNIYAKFGAAWNGSFGLEHLKMGTVKQRALFIYDCIYEPPYHHEPPKWSARSSRHMRRGFINHKPPRLDGDLHAFWLGDTLSSADILFEGLENCGYHPHRPEYPQCKPYMLL